MADEPFIRVLGEVEALRVEEHLASAPARLSLYGAAAMSTLSRRVQDTVRERIAEEVPRRTGELADSMDVVLTRGAQGWIISAVSTSPYVQYVVEGTGIYHEPDAHSPWDVEGLQHFQVDGEDVYAMHTHHEGQHPDDFPGRALERAQPAVEAALEVAVDMIWARFVVAA